MKKTEYFLGSENRFSHIAESIEDAKNKRDEFINANVNSIGAIDSEDIKVISQTYSGASGSSGHVIAIIRLTYYPKNK